MLISDFAFDIMEKLHLLEATQILKFATTEASNSTSFLREWVDFHHGIFFFYSSSLLSTFSPHAPFCFIEIGQNKTLVALPP